jgi:hypothetical protein
VLEAYNFIVNNFQPDSELFFFGFSRGAYTARAVAGLVSQFGVIAKADAGAFPALYRLYKQNTPGTPLFDSPAYKAYMQDGYRKPKFWAAEIKVVGVFDTVGALGIPDLGVADLALLRKAYAFHDTGLHPSTLPGTPARDPISTRCPQRSATRSRRWRSTSGAARSGPRSGSCPPTTCRRTSSRCGSRACTSTSAAATTTS